MYKKKQLTTRAAIKRRIRAKISGTSVRPRLSVFRSNKFISAQLIDDEKNLTLKTFTEKRNLEWASKLWKELAKSWVKEVVFDRNWYIYHWVVKAVAESAREAWLKF